jgi:hypothetical protein
MTPEAERARARLDQLDRQQRYYFFERITNPKAFDVLAEAGAFTDVTPPEVVEGKVLHYSWPPTLYLRNVVSEIPARVADLVRGVDTENQRVMYDLVELVGKMPATIQATLVRELCAWLDRPQIKWVWSTYIDISRSLALANEVAAATMLARRVLRLVRLEGENFPELRWCSRDAVAEMGDINYDHALERLIPAFLERHVNVIVAMMRDLLAQALELEDAHGSRSHDYSSAWAKSLEARPLGTGAKEVLTYRLFDTVRTAIRSGALGLVDAVALFRDCHWPIFRRMRLAIITEFGSTADMTDEVSTSGFMSAYELERERKALLTKVYPALSSVDKSRLWRSIRSSLVSKKRLREYYRAKVPENELEKWVERSRRAELFEQLQPIEPYLDGEKLALFMELKSEFPPDLNARPDDGKVWVGPQAPANFETLEALTTSELLKYVEDWRAPVGRFLAPSPEGLGRTIAPIIERRRMEVLSEVDRLLRWPPVYVWHVIDALRKHVAEPDYNLHAFVRLLSYVHLQADAYHSGAFSAWEGAEEDGERAWPTLGTITASAIADVMRAVPCERPLRDHVWEILRTLLENQDPTPDDDARHKDTEPWNYALNSVRGAAMLAVFDYARWVHRAHGGDAMSPDLIALAPELFEVLDNHLDTAKEPSPAVRSAYGQNFVSIYAMARKWTIPAIPRIFGGTAATAAAGWRTYLAMNTIYDETYEHLKNYYLLAVDALSAANEGEEASDANFAQGLATHVMRVYARGLTNLDEPDSMIRRFLRAAPAKIVGAAIRSAGSAAGAGDLPLEIWDRLRNVYESVLESYASRTLDERRSALEFFGLWVIAPSVDRAWAIDALSRTLRLTGGQISVSHRVLSWLATVSESDPYGAISVLLDMIHEGALVHFATDDSVRTVINRAVLAEGAAYRAAIQVDERLTAIGMHQFHYLFRRTGA